MGDASLSSRSDWARALLAICCASLASAFALASSVFAVVTAWLASQLGLVATEVEKAINVNVMNGSVFMMICQRAGE